MQEQTVVRSVGSEARGLVDVLEQNAIRTPDATAWVFSDRRCTHRELLERAHAVAVGLTDLGLRRGDRVVVVLKNGPELIELLFACALSGLTLVPMNYRLGPREASEIVAQVEPAAVVFGVGFGEEGVPLDRLSVRPLVLFVGGDRDEATSYDRCRDRGRGRGCDAPVDLDDILVIMFTGGTTGAAKGVMLRHRSLVASTASELAALNLGAETMLAAMPLFHVGIVHALCVLIRGGAIVLHERVDLDEIIDAIAVHGVTLTVLLPTSVGELVDRLAERAADTSSLRYVLYGAAPMDPEIVVRAIAALGPIFAGVYGLTEGGGVVAVLPQSDHRADLTPDVLRRLSSVGLALPGVTIECHDEAGRPVAAGEIGEIVVGGGGVMAGYWRRPDLSATALRDGQLCTGDLGTIDPDGYIHLVDRKSNMIVTGGENVYPREIEDVLALHPGIVEAVVAGVREPRWGEAVKAYVVARESADLTPDAVIAHCREHLAGFKTPKSVELLDALPKTAVGKIDRRAVAALESRR